MNYLKGAAADQVVSEIENFKVHRRSGEADNALVCSFETPLAFAESNPGRARFTVVEHGKRYELMIDHFEIIGSVALAEAHVLEVHRAPPTRV